METKKLFECGTIGYYSICEVVQIVLMNKKNGECWNYFTHISFLEDYIGDTERKWLSKKPISINSTFKVMILKQFVSVPEIITVLDNAVESQEWRYKEECAKLDSVFVVEPRFIPETDPTGNATFESTYVPLEWSFYKSNFIGNYYIVELFSSKEYFSSVLSKKDKRKIQNEIKKAKLQFDLYSLSDRIGNIFCKMPCEIIEHHPTKLSPERGIAGKFTRTKQANRAIKCYLTIVATNDRMVVKNQVFPFELDAKNPEYEYEIEPNRYHNVVTVIDQDTEVIYYSGEHDYSFGSDYYSMITLPNYVIQPSAYRILKVNGVDEKVETVGLSGVGEVSIEKEIYEIVQRQNEWRDKQIQESNFFRVFKNGDEEIAVDTVKAIVNDKNLLWDLKEVWLIDPYLSADDILRTVVFCKKRGIVIKCLTDIGTINGNIETRIEIASNQDRFFEAKQLYSSKLKNAIPTDVDIKMEYRTIRGTHGKAFHDRYLILKYGINRCRVWSLGISVNSLGKSHHIIQIVENPQAVVSVFEDIWKDVDCEECYIYSNLKE